MVSDCPSTSLRWPQLTRRLADGISASPVNAVIFATRIADLAFRANRGNGVVDCERWAARPGTSRTNRCRGGLVR